MYYVSLSLQILIEIFQSLFIHLSYLCYYLITMWDFSHIKILDDVLRINLVEHIEEVFLVHLQYYYSTPPLWGRAVHHV